MAITWSVRLKGPGHSLTELSYDSCPRQERQVNTNIIERVADHPGQRLRSALSAAQRLLCGTRSRGQSLIVTPSQFLNLN